MPPTPNCWYHRPSPASMALSSLGTRGRLPSRRCNLVRPSVRAASTTGTGAHATQPVTSPGRPVLSLPVSGVQELRPGHLSRPPADPTLQAVGRGLAERVPPAYAGQPLHGHRVLDGSCLVVSGKLALRTELVQQEAALRCYGVSPELSACLQSRPSLPANADVSWLVMTRCSPRCDRNPQGVSLGESSSLRLREHAMPIGGTVVR